MASVLLTMGVCVLLIAAITVRYQRRLGKHRGLSREEFIGAFGENASRSGLAGIVYDYYKSQAISKNFSIALDDAYDTVLSAGEEDIQDDAMVLLKKLRISDPSEYVAQVPEAKIRTLRDMVNWLDAVRMRSSAG